MNELRSLLASASDFGAQRFADEVLFGRLTKGGKATADLDGDKLAFSYEPNPARQPAPVA